MRLSLHFRKLNMNTISLAALSLSLAGYHLGLIDIALMLLLSGIALLILMYALIRKKRTKDSFEDHLKSLTEKSEKWPRF